MLSRTPRRTPLLQSGNSRFCLAELEKKTQKNFALTREKQKKQHPKKHKNTPKKQHQKTPKKNKKVFRAYARKYNHLPGVAQISPKRRYSSSALLVVLARGSMQRSGVQWRFYIPEEGGTTWEACSVESLAVPLAASHFSLLFHWQERNNEQKRKSESHRIRYLSSEIAEHTWGPEGDRPKSEREFPALLVVWAYQQKTISFWKRAVLYRA